MVDTGTGSHYYSGRVGGWVGGWVALEEWKLRLTSAKVEVEVEVEAELGNNIHYNNNSTSSRKLSCHLIINNLVYLL